MSWCWLVSPARLFSCNLSGFRRFYLRRAEFEFRKLAERIKRRIGQDVRRGFHEGEGDEHHAVGDAVVLARIELDLSAARGDTHHVARLDAELGKGAGRQRSNPRRLQSLTDTTPPPHYPGAP